MHARRLRQRKQLASPWLLTNRKEPFRIIIASAIAKPLSKGQEEPNKKSVLWRQEICEAEVEVLQKGPMCMFESKHLDLNVNFLFKRNQTQRYTRDRHVLAPSTKQSIQPCLGANGTLFDEFGLACVDSFTRDTNFTCSMYNGHPTCVNGIKECRVEYH